MVKIAKNIPIDRLNRGGEVDNNLANSKKTADISKLLEVCKNKPPAHLMKGEGSEQIFASPKESLHIHHNIELVRTKINQTAQKYHRNADKINLIVVSKNIDEQHIMQAIDCGCQIFGENKVMEAKAKWVNLKNQYKNIKLHLIGHLQTNKVKDAVAIFEVIQTVDSEKLAKELKKEMIKQNKFPQIFVQINIGEEEQKYGIDPKNAREVIKQIGQYLEISGVMAIPPQNQDPTPYFALLQKIAKDNNLQNISMGMSNDFETAIALGTNFIRLGTAIFGNFTTTPLYNIFGMDTKFTINQ